MTRPPPDQLTLAEQTARRLILAGITPDNPALARIRDWNIAAWARQAITRPTAPEGPP